MDEMYNNENNSSFENQDGAYGGQYQQPESNLEEPMTLGEWLITMLIMLIPCVNIIMAFVWAFSSKEKKSKSNYFKAWLIFMAIVIVLYIILLVVFGAAMAASFSAISTY